MQKKEHNIAGDNIKQLYITHVYKKPCVILFVLNPVAHTLMLNLSII